ncbi:hypothetical protein C1H46_044878 [Malus baccata]|uniref:Uncharacterized protein n=1 Tax=Malus baccata TaxID=106549 RepID=A0A540K5T1_MALBA|nr:hypothetical protein C1H46_044878 [Malus baccata]
MAFLNFPTPRESRTHNRKWKRLMEPLLASTKGEKNVEQDSPFSAKRGKVAVVEVYSTDSGRS